MRREVDSEGNVIIYGVPPHKITPLDYGSPPPPELVLPARPKGPIVFGAAVLSASVLGAVLVFGSFLSHSNVEDENLWAAMAAAEDEFAGGAGNEVFPPPTDRGIPVNILSEPEGARILIDDEPIGTTPVRGHRLDEGVYIISAAFEGAEVIDSVLVLWDEPDRTIFFRGHAAVGDADVDPLPTVAQGPVSAASRSEQLPAPVVNTPTRAEPDRSPNESATAKRPAAERSALQVPGALRFVTDPAGAEVLVNGVVRGRTPLDLADLRPAEYDVTFRLDGYAEKSLRVQVAPARTTRSEHHLVALTGTLRVLAEPWGSIYVDGELIARDTDLRHTRILPAGQHRITIVHPVLGERHELVVIEPERTHDVVIDLTPSERTSNIP